MLTPINGSDAPKTGLYEASRNPPFHEHGTVLLDTSQSSENVLVALRKDAKEARKLVSTWKNWWS